MELGDDIGPVHRRATSADDVASYVSSGQMTERLFTDPAYARALGYRGLVVPGPMVAAFAEQFLRGALPGWQIERLSTTFRIPTIVGDALLFRGAITEHHAMADERLVCDVVVEHPNGERAVTGTATMRRGALPRALP